MKSIEAIREIIEEENESFRCQGLMELYLNETREYQIEKQRIIHGSDPILKIFFIRFLASVAEDKALKYLADFLKDKNPLVAEAAKRAYDENRYPFKMSALLPVIQAPLKTSQFYAIDKLSLGEDFESVDTLIQLIEKSDDELLLHLLSALRHLPEKKLIKIVFPFLKDPREEIRFRSTLIFGALLEAGYSSCRKTLLKLIHDPSPKVRQAMLWSLKKKPSLRDLKVLFNLSFFDPDPLVRQESLIEFSAFPLPKVLKHLTRILITEKDNGVLLKAQDILLNMPDPLLIRVLKKALRGTNEGLKSKALLFLSAHAGHSRQFNKFLRRGLMKAKKDKEKVIYLEALGILGNPESVPLVKNYLKSSSPVSYTAMNSLLKILKHDPQPPLDQYLEDPLFPILYQEMLLKFFIRKGPSYFDTPRTISCLLKLLKSPKWDLKYLAAQALSLLNKPSLALPLLKVVLHEKNPVYNQLLRDHLQRMITLNPLAILPLAHKFRNHPLAINLLLEMLKEAAPVGKQISLLILTLARPPLRLLDPPYNRAFSDFVFSMIKKNRITFPELLEKIKDINGREHFIKLLIGLFKKHPSIKWEWPQGLLVEWLQQSTEVQYEALLQNGLRFPKKNFGGCS